MALREAVAPETGPPAPSFLIPERRTLHGPLIAARLRRTGAFYLAVAALGMMPVALDASAGWKAFGLGLVVPGGGFLYTSDLFFFAASVLALLGTFVAWFGTGNILAPPLVWFGAAAMASLRTHTGIWDWAEWAIPTIAAGAFALSFLGQRTTFRAAQRRGRERNRYLASLQPMPRSNGAAPALGPELTEEDLAAQRWALDLSLQPLDRFDGFIFIDQFQTAAVRYQLNFLQYALALAQYTRTPAFHGYLSEAQRNLIAKMQDKRVWKYWRLENLWGNLDANPDPIPKDNIMLSGYMGLMLGLYESNTGDERYDAEGSIAFRWNDAKVFSYDHRTIVDAVYQNFKRSPFGMFPCEPNWIYTACNAFGINTLLVSDRLHGTGHADEMIDSYRHAVDVEFLTADGRVTAIRSSRLGLTIPSLTSTQADAGTALFLTASLPDIAQRTWALVRTELVRTGDDGRPKVELRGWDKIDVGNYKISDIAPHAMCSAVAREFGDEETYEMLKGAMDSKFTPIAKDGALSYNGSVIANGMALLGRFGRAGGFRDMLDRGLPAAWRRGPILAEAPYPFVLVARAVTDGAALDLVLRPGDGAGKTTLGVARLEPGSRYVVTIQGAASELVAGADGRADVEVELAGRTEVRIAPRG